MFNTGFQSSSAIAKNMEYAVGSLTAFPDFAEELRQEVDGQASFCLVCTNHVICIILLLKDFYAFLDVFGGF